MADLSCKSCLMSILLPKPTQKNLILFTDEVFQEIPTQRMKAFQLHHLGSVFKG
jgi:hypothetical protein